MLSKPFTYKLVVICILLIFSVNKSTAQIVDEEFGKSRIQYRLFDWRHYSTPHFNIYYYYGGQDLAKHVASYMEEEHTRITDIMGYAPYAKTKIFIYNSNLDLNQSNVGLNEAKFDIAGQTNFLESQIEIAFNGSVTDFKKDLNYQVSKSYINDMLFGGLVSEILSSSYLFTVPEWFTSGIAAYIAYGWNAKMDDFVREFLTEENVSRITKLEGEEAMLAGQSIWNFISENYGRINISSILNLTRIIRNEEKSITNSLGIPYKQFLMDYRSFYLSNPVEGTEDLPSNKVKVNSIWNKADYFKSKISPNGKWLAYSANKNGRFKVKLKDISSGKTETILKNGIKRSDEKAYLKAPVFDWGDSTTLGIVVYERGVNLLKLYNPYTKEWQTRDLRRFDQINQMDIYPNGKTAVISVTDKAQSDLFLISTGRPNTRRLTNDIYDDLYPSFIPDSKKIIFSSNRPNDSTSTNDSFEQIKSHLNLFAYDIDAPVSDAIDVLTNDLGSNTNTTVTDSSAVYFLSDKSGIKNLYKIDLNNKIAEQITAYPTSIENYDILPEQKYLSLSLYNDGDLDLYFLQKPEISTPKFLMSTFRKQVELSRRIAVKDDKAKKNTNPVLTDRDTVEITSQELADSANITGKLDADDFDFESVIMKARSNQSSLLKNLSKLRKKSSITGPYDYEPSFKIDNVTVSFLFDPLYGFSPFVEYQMNDLMENNKFSGGITTSIFNSNSRSTTRFYGQYQYLARLFDYTVRFDRKSVMFRQTDNFADIFEQQFAYNILSLDAALPLSTNLRINAGPHFGNRNFTETNPEIFSGNISPVESPIQSEFLYGGKIEMIYDDSEMLGLNIRQGRRAKIAFENYNFGGDFSESFNKFTVDIRNYQRIFNEITFATRLYGGVFFGNNAPYFMLGGLNNWATLNRDATIRLPETGEGEYDLERNPLSFESVESVTPNKNLLFHEVVTGIRGFRVNELSGRNTILLTNELRIPLFRAISSDAIKSAFIRNFQLLAFYDIGTAWLGGSPWDANNSINKEVISNNSFTATIRNYKNPWLSSTGLGISTVLFGYYGTIYYALPIEDYQIQDPTILLGIGYNF